ncbi:MAG: sel1 repeat family protein [Pseudomonadota bacterium]
MKKFLFCLALIASGATLADELADANKLFAAKSYPDALKLYTKLATKGNAEAQLHLGQMYFYGEAGAIEIDKAEPWLKKSAAAGNKTAAATLDIIKGRAEHRADIDYWMSKFDGAEYKSGQYRCKLPRIPAISRQNDEIETVSKALQTWQDCYNGFVVHLNAANPMVKLIPADIAKLMTAPETEQAKVHLKDVYDGLAEEAKVNAKLLLADVDAWRKATEAYVDEHNKIIKQTSTDTIKTK